MDLSEGPTSEYTLHPERDAMSSEDWNATAATYDQEADHGLRDPEVRTAWRDLLLRLMPEPPARVADIGCGTGSLSSLLVEAGFTVHGIDSSPRMLAKARAKVSSDQASFMLGDAANPELTPGLYDVVLCRHVLWTLPDPAAVLGRWSKLLSPEGRLILIEGSWSTGAGLSAETTRELVLANRSHAETEHLTDAAYWGQSITDERYVVISRS